MDNNLKERKASKKEFNYSLIPFLLAIAYLYFIQGARPIYFLLGSGSWGVGCFVKIILHSLIVKKLPHNAEKIAGTSFINGLISGITELGGAVLFFYLFSITGFLEILAFGVGIGAFEALITGSSKSAQLFKGTELEKPALELEAVLNNLEGFKKMGYQKIMPVLERLIAGFIHIGTRGLALISILTLNPLPLLLAIASFTIADGVIGYQMLYQGKLSNLKNLNKTYLYLAVLSLATIILFLLLWTMMII